LDRSCEKLRRITKSQRRKEHPTYSKAIAADYIDHIFSRHCLLKTLMKERQKGRKDKERDISSYL